MSTEAAMTGAVPASAEAKKTFAVCFAALVATSFCFILRAFSIGAWGKEFDLSQTQMGELAGVGLWPFAISIVLLSLIIDKIGFKTTLWFAAACHLAGPGAHPAGQWLLVAVLGHVRAVAGQWRRRGGHQSADRARVPPRQDRLAEPPARRLARGLRARRPARDDVPGRHGLALPDGADPDPGGHVHRDAAAAAVPAQRARRRRRHVSRDARARPAPSARWSSPS